MFIELIIYDEPAFYFKSCVGKLFYVPFSTKLSSDLEEDCGLKRIVTITIRHCLRKSRVYDHFLLFKFPFDWYLHLQLCNTSRDTHKVRICKRVTKNRSRPTSSDVDLCVCGARRGQTSRGTLEQRSPEERSTGEARSCRALLLQKVLGHSLL